MSRLLKGCFPVSHQSDWLILALLNMAKGPRLLPGPLKGLLLSARTVFGGNVLVLSDAKAGDVLRVRLAIRDLCDAEARFLSRAPCLRVAGQLLSLAFVLCREH